MRHDLHGSTSRCPVARRECVSGRRRRPSQNDGFGEDALLKTRTEAAFRHNFNRPPEKVLEILFEPDDVEQRTAPFDIDEQVEITEFIGRFSGGGRQSRPRPIKSLSRNEIEGNGGGGR